MFDVSDETNENQNELINDGLSSTSNRTKVPLKARKLSSKTKDSEYVGKTARQHLAMLIKINTKRLDEPSAQEASNATSAEARLWKKDIQ